MVVIWAEGLRDLPDWLATGALTEVQLDAGDRPVPSGKQPAGADRGTVDRARRLIDPGNGAQRVVIRGDRITARGPLYLAIGLLPTAST